MVDTVSKDARSKIMSRIRGNNTSPELKLRKALHAMGYRYRLRKRFSEIRCTPDIVLPSQRTIIFVDGCFWHACPTCFRKPKSNTSYWGPKIKTNMERDARQNKYFRKQGWKVIRVWEHEITKSPEKAVAKILRRMNKD